MALEATHRMIVKVVIPARNEAPALPAVLGAIPAFIDEVILVDNGSTDGTGDIARAHGASVVRVETPGYGRACLAGIANAGDCDIIIFMDADASDIPEEMIELIAPIREADADLVIGSRVARAAKGSLTITQRFGNWLACSLMRLIWGGPFTDLGPFRAIHREALAQLDMNAPTFGWTVEMQVRALKLGLNCHEIDVGYRPRIGVSKISGTVRGVVLAGVYILGTIAREALCLAPTSSQSKSWSKGSTPARPSRPPSRDPA